MDGRDPGIRLGYDAEALHARQMSRKDVAAFNVCLLRPIAQRGADLLAQLPHGDAVATGTLDRLQQQTVSLLDQGS